MKEKIRKLLDDINVGSFERIGTKRQSCIINCLNCGCKLESGETWDSGDNWNKRSNDE